MSDETIKEIQFHMHKNDLRPCPFCAGKEAVNTLEYETDYRCSYKRVICSYDGAGGQWGKDENEAALLWNNRPIEDKYRKALEDINERHWEDGFPMWVHDLINEALK